MKEFNAFKKEIEIFRKEIDEIDNQIIKLLNTRGEIAKKIGNLKEELSIEIHQPKREKEIIERIKKKSTMLKPMSIEAIWKEIINASKLIQGFMIKVGHLGPKGTFTHQAALEYFPKANTEFLKFNSNSEIFESIEKGLIDYGIIPIENSLQGTVRETLDLLIEKDLFIYGESELRIIQNLLSLKFSNLSKIRYIISHPQAFAQTSTWIKTNLPNAELINVNSTAEAAHRVSELNDESYAAIGTEFSSDIYNLKVLSSKIEDHPNNYTRFLIISKKENDQKEGKIKTSVVFITKHVPGALYNVLKIFADANINLLKIESRPRRRGRWEYIFLMDFEGDKDDPKIIKILDKLTETVIWYKILGSYPTVK